MNVHRVRRDRRRPRGAAQLPWKESSWVQSFAGDSPSPLKVADLNPGFALRQIVLLLEKRKFNDCSQLINQMNLLTLKTITPEMPIDIFMDEIPHSLVILESLFSKLFIADPDNFPVMTLRIEHLLLRIVRFLARQEDPNSQMYSKTEAAMKAISSILRIIAFVDPELMKILKSRKRVMDSVLEGMGGHGLVGIESSLMTLHDALKLEFENNIIAYKAALMKLEELSLSNVKPVTLKSMNNSTARTAAPSHHKLMKVNQDQIQVRLYKNKALLNVVEPSMTSELPKLLESLQDRIESDKGALLCFGQLRKEIKTIPQDVRVAPILAQYSRGLNKVLEIFNAVSEESPTIAMGMESNGYHSDEESVIAIEMSSRPQMEDTVGQARDSGISSGAQSPAKTSSDAGDSTGSKNTVDVDIAATRHRKENRKKQDREQRARSSDKSRGRSKERRGRSKERRGVSLDRDEIKPTITRPRRNSVEESAELRMMIARINRMAAASGNRSRSRSRSRDRSEPRPPPRKHHKSAREWLWADLYHPAGEGPSNKDSSCDSQSNTSMDTVSVGATNGGPMIVERRAFTSDVERQLVEEVEKLKIELSKSLDNIQALQEREVQLMAKLSDQSQRYYTKASAAVSSTPDKQTLGLIHAFTKLYTDARQDALDALDVMSDLQQFDDADDIKTKLLFSVIVLSFRCCQVEIEEIMADMIKAARIPDTGHGVQSSTQTGYVKDLEQITLQYLHKTSKSYDITRIVEKVCGHLFSTLHDYPSLRMSSALKSYISICVQVAWQLVTHTPSYIIDYDNKEYNHQLHQRFHRNDSSTKIKCYLWPALLDASTMKCVHKGVVITQGPGGDEDYGDTKL